MVRLVFELKSSRCRATGIDRLELLVSLVGANHQFASNMTAAAQSHLAFCLRSLSRRRQHLPIAGNRPDQVADRFQPPACAMLPVGDLVSDAV